MTSRTNQSTAARDIVGAATTRASLAPPRGRQRTLSGITPSASLTLGNHLGALRRFVRQQDGTDGFFFVADLHALTTPLDPVLQLERTRSAAALFIAAGLDAQRSAVFLQSQVSAHAELAYLLECTAYIGDLSRMIQFKEKGGRPRTRASLFTYPCLMAADILLYEAESVPVGTDQRQHVELARDLAVRFNREYGDTFVVPRIEPAAVAARVADLTDPTRKMSKSAAADAPGVIRMLDQPDVIRRKIRRAVTDNDGEVRYDPVRKPGLSNLIDILAALRDADPRLLATEFTGYAQLKAACTEAVVTELDPIRRRHDELLGDPAELDRLLQGGAARARETAAPVLERARRAIGLG